MEPADRAPYAFDWSKIIGLDEKISEITRVTMSAAGAAVGVAIDNSTGRRPIISDNGKAIQLWFLCLDAFQDNPVFSGNGVNITVTCRVRTDADPYKQFERTAVLILRQQWLQAEQITGSGGSRRSRPARRTTHCGRQQTSATP